MVTGLSITGDPCNSFTKMVGSYLRESPYVGMLGKNTNARSMAQSKLATYSECQNFSRYGCKRYYLSMLWFFCYVGFMNVLNKRVWLWIHREKCQAEKCLISDFESGRIHRRLDSPVRIGQSCCGRLWVHQLWTTSATTKEKCWQLNC